MKVLVTGANGFLGSWLVKRLKDEGHEISVLLRHQKDFEEFERQGFHVHHGDVTNASSLDAAVKGQQQIYHLAGLIAYCRSEYENMKQVNVQGTENIMEAAAKHQVQRVQIASSVVAVGATFKPEVLDENSSYELSKYNLGYHESKRGAEAVLRKYVSAGKVDGVIVNPSTVYGAGDASKTTRSTQLNVARGKMFYYPPGGVSVVAVEDVVDGMVKAMEKGHSAERYILAGENMTLKDLFDQIADEAGVAKAWLPLPKCFLKGVASLDENLSKFGLHGPLPSERAYVAMMFHWYNSTKARQELGFSTRPAQQAISNSVQWMSQQGLLRK